MEKSILRTHPALLSHPPCWSWCWDGHQQAWSSQALFCHLRSNKSQQCPWQCSKGLAPDGPPYEPSAPCPASTINLPAANAGLDFLGQLLPLSAQHKFSSSMRPTQQLSMSTFPGVLGTLLGFGWQPGAGWHGSLVVFWHTSCQQCKTDLRLFACMFSFPGFPAVLLQYN